MNKEIEEMAKDINERIACCGYVEDCKPIELAERLYNADYRKIVWHKVSDGDFPEKDKRVLCYTRYNDYTTGCFTCTKSQGDAWDLDNNMCYYREPQFVIAWTELPKYKSEEEEK